MIAIRDAARKFVPVGARLSLRELAGRLGTGPSAGRLARQLEPQARLINSGMLGPSTTDGFFELVLFSDGYWTFKGHAHESGLVGHDYTAALVLTYVDPENHVYAWSNTGTIHGTTDIGSRDDDWQQDGWDPRISRHWDELRTCEWRAELHVSTNPWAVVEAIAAGIGVAGAAVAATLFVSDPETHCQWATFPHDDGTIGVGVQCGRVNQE
ncbi:hypothetical protein ACFYTQ_24025 [Nocardia sp. NPDC004068]|uniref:hypothetical protein n=1 Tax=Nocardia sp. NPDC004068 TaxID=3364303 RepID=UPI0036972DF5